MPTRSSGVTFWPSSDAVGVAIAPAAAAGLELALVVVADAPRRAFERAALRRRDRAERRLQLGRADLERGDRIGFEAVEAPRVLEHRGVAAGPHVVEDRGDALLDRPVGLGRPVRAGARARRRSRRRRSRVGGSRAPSPLAASADDGADGVDDAADRRVPSFSAAWLTISRAEIGMICSTSTRSFAFSVWPDETRSTMASARPVSGASSIEPYSLIRSTCTPLSAKWSLAMRVNLVATRRREPWRTAAA